MNIVEREEDGVVIVTLSGRIDTEGAKELETAIQNVIQSGKTKIVLDIAEVRYINSSALRILADALTYNREHHGDLHLVGISPRIRRVFEIIGFDKFFHFHDDLEAAIADF